MKDMSLIEWMIVVAIVVILGAVVLGVGRTSKTFRATCDEAGGTTVFDGRQYQCIKK